MTLNLVDVFLALIVLVGVITGWSRGFVSATLDLLTLAASLLAAFAGYHVLTEWLDRAVPALGVWTAPLAFLLLFFLVHFLLGLIATAIAGAFPRGLHAHGINRFLGMAPGAANGVIHAIVAAVILLTLPLGPVTIWARDSQVAGRLAAPAEWVEARLAPIFDPAVRRTLQALTVEPESRTRIDLRSEVRNPRLRPDLEARMLSLVNAERASAGLQPLKLDPELTEVARAHSRDMFARAYFSHYSPEGQDLRDRLRREKARFLVAGENLALAPTIGGAHQGLMNSPGHRANILRPQFGRVGIGVLDGGVHGLMVTQNFRN